ncbi:MAG: hypothetical protein NVS9B1_16150 [Candidatus Dormibacteraceae bacterium]
MNEELLQRTNATRNLLSSLASRRGFLKVGATATAAGVGIAAFPSLAVAAGSGTSPDSVQTILDIARTAEQLAVTFYTNGVRHARQLGLSGSELDYLKAALIEEQIHQTFFTSNGGASLVDTFSFPQGATTFSDLGTFIATQQQLEGVFDSAFLCAVREFAEMSPSLSRLAQISAQIALIESEHRVLGRDIAASHGISLLPAPSAGQTTTPADNWAYAPVILTSVGQAPAVVAGAGYFSPVEDNSYTYAPVNFDGTGPDPLGLAPVAAQILYKDGPYSARP